jgi:hypothetical protein
VRPGRRCGVRWGLAVATTRFKLGVKQVDLSLWWVTGVSAERLASGRWRVVAYSVQAPGVLTAPSREVLYAPADCASEAEAAAWSAHSRVWERLRLHSQGSRLMSLVKAKYPERSLRKELFTRLCQNLTDEFMTGWMYTNQDAQNIVARRVLGMESARW